MMKSIKKNKLKDEIRNNIQNAILTGEIKPGDRLAETRIAAEMGVSQAPVREALKELEHIGLIESRPYQSAYVKQFTKKDLLDAYEARLVLELYAVESVALRIDDAQLADLRALLQNMNEAASSGDIGAFVEHDIAFHEYIVDVCSNKMISHLWHLAYMAVWTYMTANFSQRTIDNLAARHLDLYQTLEAHDVEKAKQAIKNHLIELRDELAEFWDM